MIGHCFIVLQPHDVFDAVYDDWDQLANDFLLGEEAFDGWKVIDVTMFDGKVLGFDERLLSDVLR